MIPWSVNDVASRARVRDDLATVRQCVEDAIRGTGASEDLLAAISPALDDIGRRCLTASFHLEQLGERMMRRENAHEKAQAAAESRVRTTLAGLQAEMLGDGGFDPRGLFVYCLWGGDEACPLYVGQSENILARLGQHLGPRNGKRLQVRRVTLLRCKTRRHMNETEARMILHYEPPLNIYRDFPRIRQVNGPVTAQGNGNGG